MSDKERMVLVDTDFINHVVSSCKNSDDGERLLLALFDELGFVPYVHPWVAEFEFVDTKLKNTISHRIIKTLSWSELIGDNDELLPIYEFNVIDLYEKLTNIKLDLNGRPITTFRMAGSSLGEVQSVAAAQQLNVPILCSNDHGSKDLATLVNSSAYKLEVYNTSEIAIKISENQNTNIDINYCKSMIHNATEKSPDRRKKFVKILKNNYRKHSENKL